MHEDIIAFPFEDASLPVNIQAMGVSYCDGSYRIHRAHSQIYVLEYIIQGTGTLCQGGKEYHPSKGDFYLLRRGSAHRYFSSGDNPWEKIWINVKGPLMDKLLELYPLDGQTVFPGFDCFSLFEKLYSLCRLEIDYAAVCRQAAWILHEIIGRAAMSLAGRGALCADALLIKAALDNALEKKMTLAELSEKVHLSPSQIIRVFKKEYRMTPYAYLMERRIETAKILLQNSRLSTKQIAEKLKFADEHYFSHYFKGKIGVSPRDYKKQAGGIL